MNGKSFGRIAIGLLALALFTGCSSSKIKARKEERDRLALSNHLYCDFVNGEAYPDVEVELSLEVAKHCQDDKTLSITNYRSPSENVGLVYCCSFRDQVKTDSKSTTK